MTHDENIILGLSDSKDWEFSAPATFLRAAHQDAQAAEALRHIHRAGAVRFYVDALQHALQALLLEAHSDEEDIINEGLDLLLGMKLIASSKATVSSLRTTFKTDGDGRYPTGFGPRTQHERLTEMQVEQVRRVVGNIIDLVDVAVAELAAFSTQAVAPLVGQAA